MQRPDRIVFLALALAALVVIDLIKTLRTGRARSMWTGTFSREVEPQRFRRYVYGSYAVLMFCAGLVLWALWLLVELKLRQKSRKCTRFYGIVAQMNCRPFLQT